MDYIGRKNISLAHKLTCEILELSSVKELNYYEVNHVIALSLAVNEVYARAGAGVSKYWRCICDFSRENDIYDSIEVQVCENSFDGYEIDVCNYMDLENIALFTMEYVEDKLNIDKGYFNTDLTGQVANIVNDWQYNDHEKKAGEISDLALSIVNESNTIWNWEKLLSYYYHYKDLEFSTDLKYLFKEEVYSEKEAPFLSALALSFSKNEGQFTINREIYTALAIHFKVFKDAHVVSILDDVIGDENLYLLVFDMMKTKLFKQAFYEGSKARQDYFSMVLYCLNQFSGDVDYDNGVYADYLVHTFFITAIKGNPLTLSASDFTPQHVMLYSKLLKDILLEQFREFEKMYERIIVYREEQK